MLPPTCGSSSVSCGATPELPLQSSWTVAYARLATAPLAPTVVEEPARLTPSRGESGGPLPNACGGPPLTTCISVDQCCQINPRSSCTNLCALPSDPRRGSAEEPVRPSDRQGDRYHRERAGCCRRECAGRRASSTPQGSYAATHAGSAGDAIAASMHEA
jgi:hypothetical protein